MARVEASVVRAENAPENEGWADAQEHSASFHRAIVGLLGSPLLDEFYLNLQKSTPRFDGERGTWAFASRK